MLASRLRGLHDLTGHPFPHRLGRDTGSRWCLRELPRWLQALVAVVVTGYFGAICASAAVTRFQTGQLRLFAVLVACSAVAVELTRRTGEPAGAVRDVYAIWDLPAAVLLPPLFALLAPIPRMALTQVRVRQTPLHPRAYTTSVVGLGYAAASLAFHAAAPALGLGAAVGAGGRAMLWTVLAAGCGLLRLAINDGLVLAAVKGSSPGTRLLPEIAGVEALYGRVSELSLGTLSAFAAAHSALAILYAVPLVVSLQRSLRHAQLLSETRVDGKTGLLNDVTWRREAASEIERAVRTGAPVALGILDIDHFKDVNDTYGHLAGDAVLSAVAAATTALLRDYDVIGRVGGEEFAFVLPNSPAEEAAQIAERLREKIPRLAYPNGGPGGLVPARVTVSIGVAAASRPSLDLDSYYSLADQALYAAKSNGRDAVWVVREGQATGMHLAPIGAARASAGCDAAGQRI
jgi:diguanylate cyclase (GGDEF)-like protein